MARKPKKLFYHIILTNHGKQLRDLYFTHSEALVNKRFNAMLKENKKVVFPMRYNNHEHVMKECNYELIIIKGKDEFDNDVQKIRDEYGKFIYYESSDEDWIIYDRANYDIEETFWVYGYHPRIQRKDFNWIFDTFIEKDAKNKYVFKSVVVYKNKLLIDYNGKLEMVICKNKSDCIRMYNMIEKRSMERKHKNVAFMGDIADSKYKKMWMDRIR
ncbi:MAG: hypothetical protein J6O49_11530, partial [Bacteroidaceae bacterium]|nr:hypothetical protein [Bacteroidaceae bacterium]